MHYLSVVTDLNVLDGQTSDERVFSLSWLHTWRLPAGQCWKFLTLIPGNLRKKQSVSPNLDLLRCIWWRLLWPCLKVANYASQVKMSTRFCSSNEWLCESVHLALHEFLQHPPCLLNRCWVSGFAFIRTLRLLARESLDVSLFSPKICQDDQRFQLIVYKVSVSGSSSQTDDQLHLLAISQRRTTLYHKSSRSYLGRFFSPHIPSVSP